MRFLFILAVGLMLCDALGAIAVVTSPRFENLVTPTQEFPAMACRTDLSFGGAPGNYDYNVPGCSYGFVPGKSFYKIWAEIGSTGTAICSGDPFTLDTSTECLTSTSSGFFFVNGTSGMIIQCGETALAQVKGDGRYGEYCHGQTLLNVTEGTT